MDGNHYSILAVAATAVKPEIWPEWVKRAVIAVAASVMAAGSGAGLVVWRTQGIIEQKLEAIRVELGKFEQHEEKTEARQDASIQRLHERINRHLENGHTPLTWPKQPK